MTVPTLEHGPVTLACPAWCAVDHTAGPVLYRADVAHIGLELPLTVPVQHGPAEWLHVCVDQGRPLSAHDPSAGVVEVSGEAVRDTPADLRALVGTLTAQPGEVRAHADRIAEAVTDWGVPP